ncbi:hypothetical protein [Pedobacter frigiditerrae]|uniref:hypothetical protein n=1 Tax=Pedobacter frigiditerrae TaxID=2530452 RepID=UPI00292DE1D2|nr:hypothetical protein [Pedobacter frigiditerrae]
MNKWIKKAIIGSVIISVIIPAFGYFFYISDKNNSKRELQELIDNRYLEGKQQIGAYSLDLDTIKVEKVADFNIADKISWYGVNDVSIWNSLTFSNREKITQVMAGDEFKWYNFKQDVFSPFMIVVKKTDKGYDIIGEYIIGLGLTYNFPDNLIHKTSSTMDFSKLSGGGPTTFYNYSIMPSLVYSYVNDLTKNKYQGILFRNEITREQNGVKENKKLTLLQELVIKSVAPVDEGLYFRVNNFFELKYNDNYTYIGSGPIQMETSSYGNTMSKVFTRTVTLHYSIEENEGILKNKYVKIFSPIFLGGIIFYLLVIFGLYKKFNKN